jgi:hypothetical protein
MIEKAIINLSDRFFSIQHGTVDWEQIIQEILSASQPEILLLLSGYYYIKRGKIHHLRLELNTIRFNTSFSGHVTVRYNINYNNGCQDLTYDIEDEAMVIAFEIDFNRRALQLYGEEVPEREPDEI